MTLSEREPKGRLKGLFQRSLIEISEKLDILVGALLLRV
jgi:hypothetical protein